MQIIKGKLDIDETLNKRIKNILKFLNIKEKIHTFQKIDNCRKNQKFPVDNEWILDDLFNQKSNTLRY